MSIFQGATNYLALLVGDSLLTTEFPKQYEFQTKTIAVTEAPKKAEKPKEQKKPKPKQLSSNERQDLIERGASELLVLLQREGRLVDFLQQEIDEYDDEDIGAAVREIHKGCRKVLSDHFSIEPIFKDAEEDDDVTIEDGFDPEEIRVVGNVKGKPPYKATLRHHGWKATKVKLPQVAKSVNAKIFAAAEVEV